VERKGRGTREKRKKAKKPLALPDQDDKLRKRAKNYKAAAPLREYRKRRVDGLEEETREKARGGYP